MNEPFDDDEKLESVTADAWVTPPVSDTVRTEVLTRTSTHVRRRGRRHAWLSRGAVAAAAYVAGIATAAMLSVDWGDNLFPADKRSESTSHESESARPELDGVLEKGAINPEALALALLQLKPADQALLLRRAGDWYLYQEDDVIAAKSCYERMFAIAPATDKMNTEEDSWLLIAMMRGRAMEESNDDFRM